MNRIFLGVFFDKDERTGSIRAGWNRVRSHSPEDALSSLRAINDAPRGEVVLMEIQDVPVAFWRVEDGCEELVPLEIGEETLVSDEDVRFCKLLHDE